MDDSRFLAGDPDRDLPLGARAPFLLDSLAGAGVPEIDRLVGRVPGRDHHLVDSDFSQAGTAQPRRAGGEAGAGGVVRRIGQHADQRRDRFQRSDFPLGLGRAGSGKRILPSFGSLLPHRVDRLRRAARSDRSERGSGSRGNRFELGVGRGVAAVRIFERRDPAFRRRLEFGSGSARFGGSLSGPEGPGVHRGGRPAAAPAGFIARGRERPFLRFVGRANFLAGKVA